MDNVATMDRVAAALASFGIPGALIAEVPALPDDATGLLMYGSRARGDAVEGSDLDLLALVPDPHPSINAGDVSLSFYTSQQLRTGIGTLFGAHLRRDAKTLWDPSGRLSRTIAEMGQVDTSRLLARAREMTSLFTTLDRDLPTYLPGLLRQARYLLRSALYAEAISVGRPCFSVREIAQRYDDPDLVELLASRQTHSAEFQDLSECLRRLDLLVHGFPSSKHGSLEATIVNEWGNPSDLLSAAFIALGSTGNGSVYAEVEKILL